MRCYLMALLSLLPLEESDVALVALLSLNLFDSFQGVDNQLYVFD